MDLVILWGRQLGLPATFLLDCMSQWRFLDKFYGMGNFILHVLNCFICTCVLWLQLHQGLLLLIFKTISVLLFILKKSVINCNNAALSHFHYFSVRGFNSIGSPQGCKWWRATLLQLVSHQNKKYKHNISTDEKQTIIMHWPAKIHRSPFNIVF